MIELKNPADENATIRAAFNQLQTYKTGHPEPVPHSTSCWSSPTAWRPASARSPPTGSGSCPGGPIDGEDVAPKGTPELEVLIKGDLRPAPVPRPDPPLHRLRGRRADGRQEAGRLPPVPRRQQGGRLHGRGGLARGRQARRRRLAHAGVSGKSLTMAFYAGQDHPPPGDGEPDARRPDRPQRPGRPALRHLLRAARTCCARRPCRPRTATTCEELLKVASGGVVFTTIQKFLPDDEGRQVPAALRPAQHRRHRRRGPPQPVRLHRRLRPPPARRPAERLVHRLHRHADRADRQEHPGRLRRLHRRLRHPAGRRGRRDGPHLLRGPAGQDRAGRGRAAEDRRRSSRRSPRARRSSGRRSSRASGRGWRRWSAPRSGSPWSPRTSSSTSSSGSTRWTARR